MNNIRQSISGLNVSDLFFLFFVSHFVWKIIKKNVWRFWHNCTARLNKHSNGTFSNGTTDLVFRCHHGGGVFLLWERIFICDFVLIKKRINLMKKTKTKTKICQSKVFSCWVRFEFYLIGQSTKFIRYHWWLFLFHAPRIRALEQKNRFVKNGTNKISWENLKFNCFTSNEPYNGICTQYQ